MLTLQRHLRNLCDFMVFNKFRFKISKLDVSNLNTIAINSSVIHCNLNNSEKKIVRYPLCEVGNLNNNQLNCDLVKWYEIVDEIFQAKAAGKKLPEYLRLQDIDELLNCKSKTQRLMYLTFLFKKEKRKLNEVEKRLKKRAERAILNTKNASNNGHIQYGAGKNSLIPKIWSNRVHKFYDKRLANAILFGQKIVIDLGYDEFMTTKERRGCASQVSIVYGINRQNSEPYNIFMCNAKSESLCVQHLRQLNPNIDESLTTLTDQSYLDIFPKEDLVYLSPHAAEPLKIYDHKAVYIIGGFVDTVHRKHISSFKSQDEGIKSYSLPLDDYILWGSGSRSLSINQVFSIMLTMKDTGDWKQAFKHVPTRKLRRLKADSDETQCISEKLFAISN